MQGWAPASCQKEVCLSGMCIRPQIQNVQPSKMQKSPTMWVSSRQQLPVATFLNLALHAPMFCSLPLCHFVLHQQRSLVFPKHMILLPTSNSARVSSPWNALSLPAHSSWISPGDPSALESALSSLPREHIAVLSHGMHYLRVCGRHGMETY